MPSMYEVLKIAYWCSPPFSLVAQAEVQNTKFKREWGAHGRGLKFHLGEGWKRKETKVVGRAVLWYFYGIAMSDSAPCRFQKFQRLCFQILLFQRNIISIKHISMYFIAECHVSKERIGQILHDLSNWLHFIKSNYYISKYPGQEQPTGKHISIILKNNQQIPRN